MFVSAIHAFWPLGFVVNTPHLWPCNKKTLTRQNEYTQMLNRQETVSKAFKVLLPIFIFQGHDTYSTTPQREWREWNMHLRVSLEVSQVCVSYIPVDLHPHPPPPCPSTIHVRIFTSPWSEWRHCLQPSPGQLSPAPLHTAGAAGWGRHRSVCRYPQGSPL